MDDAAQMHLLSLTSIQNLDTRVDKPFLYIIWGKIIQRIC